MFFEVVGDVCLYGIEGCCCMCYFVWVGFCERLCWMIWIEMFYGFY